MNKTIAAKTLWLTGFICLASLSTHAQPQASAQPQSPIPMDQLGVVAGKQYQGDGLSIRTTPNGARLHCVFQRLEGEATPDGLWLRSTAEGSNGERLRVVATEVGRVAPCAPFQDWLGSGADGVTRPTSMFQNLPLSGIVNVADNLARFIRNGLTEEYSVSMDGVRQDFIIQQRPAGGGELRVELNVTGAFAETLPNGVRLTLNGSGRKLAYARLQVTDADGRELTARIEVTTENRLAIVVDDVSAVYPVRIDPTFSDADWISMGGVPGTAAGSYPYVYAAAADGAGNLYIGGGFFVVGEVTAKFIAKWNGSSWTNLGSGVNGIVNALAVSGNAVYAGGEFTTAGGSAANYIAKWDGTSWSALGSGTGGYVSALATSGSNVYAATANYVAKWNGNSWSALGSGMQHIDGNPTVWALAVSGSDVYAGGYFTTAGGNAARGIAKWDGSNWTSLGSGLENSWGDAGETYALAASGSNVYVGGDFVKAGGIAASRIAKWNGSTWTNLGSGIYGGVYALAVSGSNVFAGGRFTDAGGITAFNIARWNGSSWTNLNSGIAKRGIDPSVYAVATSGNNLYAGGYFDTAGGIGTENIAKWNGTNWSALGSGLNSRVNALAVSGTDLYVGGNFTTVGGLSANYVAKWNGSSWSALGSGMGGGTGLGAEVNALAVSGTNLYAGGYFTTAGGVPASCIARWNGISWSGSAVGGGVFGNINVPYPTVSALAVSGTNLYAGGTFTKAGGVGGVFTYHIAKWNGSSWSALGLGVGGQYGAVKALVVSGPDLYVGGSFSTAGGSAATNIAKWNGNSWSALGSGLGNEVLALAASGNVLYVGGYFDTAGGVQAESIARWNGSNWSALGSGLDEFATGFVYALAVSGTDLYVGGSFSTAGGIVANSVAKWDGSSWSAMGSGINGSVDALGVLGTNLYAGGGFTTAGDKVSVYLARANIGIAPGRFANISYATPSGLSFTFLEASEGQPYRIQVSPSLAAGPWTDFTNFTYNGAIVMTAPIAGNTNRFFRAVTP